MQKNFVTFERFNQIEPAQGLMALLKENNIEYILEDVSPDFEVAFVGKTLLREYRVKLQQKDFEKVEDLQQQNSLDGVAVIEENYYLLKFSDEQLAEIIIKRDEWSKFDFVLAKKLLKDKGKEITNEQIILLRKQRIEELAKPEQMLPVWLIFGYLTSLAGGFGGIIIGWLLLTKKTLPDGSSVYGYQASDRKHGNRMIIIGVIVLVFGIIFSVVYPENILLFFLQKLNFAI